MGTVSLAFTLGTSDEIDDGAAFRVFLVTRPAGLSGLTSRLLLATVSMETSSFDSCCATGAAVFRVFLVLRPAGGGVTCVCLTGGGGVCLTGAGGFKTGSGAALLRPRPARPLVGVGSSSTGGLVSIATLLLLLSLPEGAATAREACELSMSLVMTLDPRLRTTRLEGSTMLVAIVEAVFWEQTLPCTEL